MDGDEERVFRQSQRVRPNDASLARLHRDKQHSSDTMEQMNSRNDRSQREIDISKRKAIYQQRRTAQREDKSYRKREQPNEVAAFDSQPKSSQDRNTTLADQKQRLPQQQQVSEARPRHRVSGRFYVQRNGQYGSRAVKEDTEVQEAEADEEEVYGGQEYRVETEERHMAHNDSDDIGFEDQYWPQQRHDGNQDEHKGRLTRNKPEYVIRAPNRSRPREVRQPLIENHPEYVTRASIHSQPPSVLLTTSHESDIDQGPPEANNHPHIRMQQQTDSIQGHRQRDPVHITREQVPASNDDGYQFEVQGDREHQSHEDGYDGKEEHSTVPRTRLESVTKSRATGGTTAVPVSKKLVQPNTKLVPHQDASANLRGESKATITEAEMKSRFENVQASVSKRQIGIKNPTVLSNLESKGSGDRPISSPRPVGRHYYAGGHMQTGSDTDMSRNVSIDGSSLLSFHGERPTLSGRDSRSSRVPMQYSRAAIVKTCDELDRPEQRRSFSKEEVSVDAERIPSESKRTSIQSAHPVTSRSFRDESEGMIEQPMVGSSLTHWQAIERSNLERQEGNHNELPSAVYQDEIDSDYSLRRRTSTQRQKQPWTQQQQQQRPQRQECERHSSEQAPDARHQYTGTWQTRVRNPNMEVMESFEAEESYQNDSLRWRRQPSVSHYFRRASISEYPADISSDTSEYRSPTSATPTATPATAPSSATESTQPGGLPITLSHAKAPGSSGVLSTESQRAKELARSEGIPVVSRRKRKTVCSRLLRLLCQFILFFALSEIIHFMIHYRPTSPPNTVTFRGRNYVADQDGFYTFLDDGFGTTSMAYCEDLWEFPNDPRSRSRRVPSTLHQSLEATLNAGSNINRVLLELMASVREAMHPLSTENDSNRQSEERHV